MSKIPLILRQMLFLALAALLIGALPARAAKVAAPRFPSAEAAFDALLAAGKTGEPERMVAVLGPGSRPIIRSGDPVADKDTLTRFVTAATERVFYQREGDKRVIVSLGFDNWPLPIPIVKAGDTWAFDAKAGVEEVLNRRIGRNELSTIETLRAIVAAQKEYYATDPDQDGVVEYAGRIMSSEGKKNGLYWASTGGANLSPLGPLIAQAQQGGYSKQGAPYHGYYFRVLSAQGRDARGGAYSYLKNGHMVGGYAVLAWPATYGNSGVTAFQVNANGVIWQKDLGPKTDSMCRAMMEYNPDKTWAKVK